MEWRTEETEVRAALAQDPGSEPEFKLTPLQRSWLIDQGHEPTLEAWLLTQGYIPSEGDTTMVRLRARALDERMLKQAPRDPTLHVLTGGAA